MGDAVGDIQKPVKGYYLLRMYVLSYFLGQIKSQVIKSQQNINLYYFDNFDFYFSIICRPDELEEPANT